MRGVIAVKNRKLSTQIKITCRYLLFHLEMIGIPILVAMLIITFMIFTFGNESAYSQCGGLCLYDTNIHQTNIPAAGVDARYQKQGTGDSGADTDIPTGRALVLPDLPEESSRQNSGILHSQRVRVSQGLSHKFAINDIYTTETASDNSDTSVFASNDAEANTSSQTPKSKDWEFILAPYGWFTSISEDIEVNGQGASGHATFFDLLEHLDIAGMLHGEVWWKGRIGIYADTIYSKLALNKDVALRRLGSISAGLQTTMFIQEFGGLYRVGTWPVGSPYNQFVQRSKPSVTFNILAGGRYWHLKNELDVRGPLGILSRQIDQSQNWFDFIVGGRARLEFYKKLFFELTTDIGGFDLSFSSKFSWNVLAVVGYELSWYRITPLIGFRALYDNYANGSGNSRFDSKMWMYGPALGVAFKF